MTRRTQLPYEKQIKWSVQSLGHFESNRHPPARKRQDNDIRTAGVLAEARREFPSGFAAIGKTTIE